MKNFECRLKTQWRWLTSLAHEHETIILSTRKFFYLFSSQSWEDGRYRKLTRKTDVIFEHE